MPKHKIYIDSLEKLSIDIHSDEKSQFIGIELSDELKQHPNLTEHILINKKPLKDYLKDGTYLLEKNNELPEKVTVELADSSSSIKIATFNQSKDEVAKERALTNYELRTLNQSRVLPVSKSQLKPITSISKTDLHTHYPALMTSEEILSIATNHWSRSYYCDCSLLEKIGINSKNYKIQKQEHLSKDEKKYYVKRDPSNDQIIDILTLSSHDKNILMQHLSVPQVKQITFEDMEVIYERRDAFVKNPHLFKEYLTAIAQNYQKQGIKHPSISFSKIIDPEWLFIADHCLPIIEQETGVTLSFLAGISRHADSLEMQELIHKIIQMADHPFVNGFDILATETNSTFEFIDKLEWAMEHIKTNFDLTKTPFIIRVHAGETSYHPENVRVMFEFAKKYPHIQIRIGHGIYGVVDEETLKLGSKLDNVIIEMNPDSNYALNMVDMYNHYPLESYVKHNIPVVFGTDGHGLYQTTYSQIYNNINYYCENPEQVIANIEKTEKKYIETISNGQKERETLFIHKMKVTSQFLIEKEKINLKPFNVSSLNDLKTYKNDYPADYEKIFKAAYTVKSILTEEKKKLIKERNEEKQKIRKQNLDIKLNEHQIKLITNTKNENEFINKTPIMITGSSKSEKDIQTAMELVNAILKSVDPDKVYFVSDGTDFGLNKLVSKLIKKHNQTHKEAQFKLVGILPTDIDADDLSKHLTHATTQECRAWYQLPECMVKNYKEVLYIALGSDMLIRDTIQVLYNETKDTNNLYLLADAKGNLVSNNINFVLNNLYNKHSKLFKSEPLSILQKEGFNDPKKDFPFSTHSQMGIFRRKTEGITKVFCDYARNNGMILPKDFASEFRKWSKMPAFKHKFYEKLSNILLDKEHDTRNLIEFCKVNQLIQNEQHFMSKIDMDNKTFGKPHLEI